MSLNGKIALVTGASRGIGRGIALQLGSAGATVYITGRSPALSLSSTQEDMPTLKKTEEEINERGGKGIAVYCDHSKMDEVEKLFKRIAAENDGVLDILVNNAFSAVSSIADAVGKSFWECEPELWDSVNNVGLRNHYFCCVHAARLMVPRKKGLIINISSAGGLRYLFCVPYGVGKTAMDRMAVDMGQELSKHDVTMISLWPGVVQTETFGDLLKSGKFDDHPEMKMLQNIITETPEYTGKAVVALAEDKNVNKKCGKVVIAADVGIDYKFKDINGNEPGSLRAIKTLLNMVGFTSIASFFPPWLRLPGWVLSAVHSRF